MKATSVLLVPPEELSRWIFAAIVRDTRETALNAKERFNFFPASPLVSVTHIACGEVRSVPAGGDPWTTETAEAFPETFVLPPQNTPTVSWSAGPVLVVTVGFYPDAWSELASKCDVPGHLKLSFAGGDDLHANWKRFCSTLSAAGSVRERRLPALSEWTGVPRLSDWTRSIVGRAALAGPGCSLRALQRRLKLWSGQTRRSLEFYAAFERLHHLSIDATEKPLAEIALEAEYSDQSHMGRAVRRATGFSPAQLNRLIEAEEAFWCYRLLGERF